MNSAEHYNLRSGRLRLAALMLSLLGPARRRLQSSTPCLVESYRVDVWRPFAAALPSRSWPVLTDRLLQRRLKKFDASALQQHDHLFLDGRADVFRGQAAP